MIRTHPASLAIVAVLSLSLSATPIAYSQQAGPSFPDGGQGPTTAYEIKLCVPADIVERDLFEQPAPGSKMEAFHKALRYFLLDRGDVRLEYRVRQNAFESFDPANADPSDLLQEVSAEAKCPDANYSYTIPVKRVSQNAAQDASQSAAQRASASDSLNRGWQYQVGRGVPKDPAMAARLYADAANEGLPDAMYRLALLYRDGNGVSKDSAAAVNWFYQAGKQGHAAAQMELGFAFLLGDGVRHDDVAAFRWLQLAAQAGLPRAQGALGAMYQAGQGVTQNEVEANAWFRKAAEQGQIIATYYLADSLRLGRGVTRNESEAMQWYQKSATAGYAPAQARLGAGYLTGSGAAQDYHLAAHWLTEAARQGDPWAQLLLGGMYADGTGVDRNLAQARALYAHAASGQVPEAAERARESAAALPDTSDEALPDHPAHSSNTNAVIGLAAVAVGAVLLFSLLSRSSSDDAAAAAPSNGSSSLAGPFGSDSPSTRPDPPPTPHCHSAPVEDPFTIRPGLYTPHGGSTLVCD